MQDGTLGKVSTDTLPSLSRNWVDTWHWRTDCPKSWRTETMSRTLMAVEGMEGLGGLEGSSLSSLENNHHHL